MPVWIKFAKTGQKPGGKSMRIVRPHLRPEKVSLGLTIAGLVILAGFVLLVAFHEQWGKIGRAHV